MQTSLFSPIIHNEEWFPQIVWLNKHVKNKAYISSTVSEMKYNKVLIWSNEKRVIERLGQAVAYLIPGDI